MRDERGPDFIPSLGFMSAGVTAQGQPAVCTQLRGAGAGMLRAAGEAGAVRPREYGFDDKIY